MTNSEKEVYYGTGRATVGEIQQFIDGELVRFYVGRLRGKFVGPKDNFKFKTKEEALKCASDFRENCRTNAKKMGLL